jgi:hypothetical protein
MMNSSRILPLRQRIPLRLLRDFRGLELCCVLVLLASGLRAAERAAILDPYFYRVPVFDPIEGSSETVIGYYRTADGELTPILGSESSERADIRQESLKHARALLRDLKPVIIRDSHQVITAVRLTSPDQTLTSIMLLPELENVYANLLGPRSLAAVPNRRTIFLFPRSGTSIREYGNEVLSYYHNDPWPVSVELFDLRAGNPKSIHRFEVD